VHNARCPRTAVRVSQSSCSKEIELHDNDCNLLLSVLP
jgi:hypothetical protein